MDFFQANHLLLERPECAYLDDKVFTLALEGLDRRLEELLLHMRWELFRKAARKDESSTLEEGNVCGHRISKVRIGRQRYAAANPWLCRIASPDRGRNGTTKRLNRVSIFKLEDPAVALCSKCSPSSSEMLQSSVKQLS